METNAAPAAAPQGNTSATPSAPATQAGAKPTTQSSSGEATQAKNPAVAAGEGKPDAKAQAAKAELFEVKVNGRIVRMTRDELVARASEAEAAQQRFKEAAQMKKQAEALVGKMRDPKQVIAALQDPSLGLTKDQIREQFEEWYSREFIEPEQLTPEQKKIREYERKIQEYADRDKQTEEDKRRAHEESLTSKAREELQGQIIEVLDTSGLPKTNFTIRRIAYWMQRNQANGFNAPTEVVVAQVRNEMQSSLRDLVEASDGDVLIKLLGDNVIQKLRKYDLDQLRKLRGGGNPPAAQEEYKPSEPRGERPPTSAEVNQRLRDLQRTGRF